MMRTVFVFVCLILGVAAGPALAAPQILGLVATHEPVPMQCADGTCTALLSAFCLQEARLPPDFETVYLPAAAGSMTLVATMADGSVQRLDAAGPVRFRSRYGYTAIRADLALDELGAMAPVALALEVAPRAAMLPAAVPGDPDPQAAEEIALATGPWRIAAEAVLEGGSERARAARVTARLINALPPHGDIAASARPGLWRHGAGAMAPALARRTFEACIRSVDQSAGYPLRRCLEERHEAMQIRNTRDYWKSLGGS